MNHFIKIFVIILFIAFVPNKISAQQSNPTLSINRIYSSEFRQEYMNPIQWIEDGNAYVTKEKSKTIENGTDLVHYQTSTQKRSIYISAKHLVANGKPINIESFTLSEDGTKVLIFTNSSRVWRTNTKGDYWVYDFNKNKLSQLGKSFDSSSLMFAKFSVNNKFVAYVHGFNIYKENFTTGKVTQLTEDGSREIINGTFDWAYEEEFGKRDGFKWSPKASKIAFWQIDASKIRDFHMIDNLDSVYSQVITMQYPMTGETPAGAKVGIINMKDNSMVWVKLPGDIYQNYIPGIQWVNDDLLILQQLNRKQNNLKVWTYIPSTSTLKEIYSEKEETYVELNYPDISANGWASNNLTLVDNNKSFLRMTENDGWRHIYKVNLKSGNKTLVTPGNYDVAAMIVSTKKEVYYMASPSNSTQRYLYSTDLKGRKKKKRITPEEFDGVNSYNISPNAKFAFHTNESVNNISTTRLVKLPYHKIIKTFVSNDVYKDKLAKLNTPDIKFITVTTTDGVEIDARIIFPIDFDKSKKYPVLFHAYGEPWGQVATDNQVGLWNIMLAQKGYVIIDMDNRGTPCLKGSAWRKAIYAKSGQINVRDQAMAATELLKLDYLDNNRVAIWGWSGGGSMTLNLMFQYPEIYKTGIAVAAVSSTLIYDNIYQERYFGLPQENMDAYIKGSPITYVKNLKGNLLIVHGTTDDNVHYQSAEMLIDELIKYNKQFRIMPYPNRSHGIYERTNTRRHLYTLMTNYLLEMNPVN